MSKKATVTIYALLGVLLVAVIAAVIIIVSMSNQHSDEREKQDENMQALESSSEALNLSLDELQALKKQLEADKAALEAKVTELEAGLADAGVYYAEEIASLNADIVEKASAIASLEADIAKYRTVFNIDVRAQAQLIDEIVLYIEENCPFAKVTIDASEDGEGEEKTEWVLISTLVEEERAKVTAEEELLFTPEELEASELTEEELTEKLLLERVFAREDVAKANISVYYEDLATGYHFDYNANYAYNSASVVKAPYVMSVLMAVAEDEKAYLAKLAASGELPEQIDTDEDGEPDKIKIEYSDPNYDLSEVVVYDSATMYRTGSGVIKNMEDGTEFTYLDFMKYTLEESDNIAYAQIRNRFSYNTMYNLASSVGANITGSTMTAKGAGKLFKAIWEFIEDDDTYGPIMAESMSKANHTVIIPFGVSPKKALHKYGWDTGAYHDAAIVMAGDHPYVLAVFTDLDNGGDDVNAYLREIIKRIDKLHSGFYAN